jgi:hypothetical protein
VGEARHPVPIEERVHRERPWSRRLGRWRH